MNLIRYKIQGVNYDLYFRIEFFILRDICMQAAEKGDHVIGYSLHPGTVKTEITR